MQYALQSIVPQLKIPGVSAYMHQETDQLRYFHRTLPIDSKISTYH